MVHLFNWKKKYSKNIYIIKYYFNLKQNLFYLNML